MDIERKITKKHIMIGIACLVFVIGALILILTACGNDSNKEKPIVEETTTEITSTTTTTTETSKTTKATTTTSTSTTESTSSTSEATTTTTTVTTEEVEDIPVINDEPETSVVKPVETPKAPVVETKPATTTTAKPVETEPPVVETQAPAASCNHYYGEVASAICHGNRGSCNGVGWYYALCCWEYKEDGTITFSSIGDSEAGEYVRDSEYMKPSNIGVVKVNCWIYLG